MVVVANLMCFSPISANPETTKGNFRNFHKLEDRKVISATYRDSIKKKCFGG